MQLKKSPCISQGSTATVSGEVNIFIFSGVEFLQNVVYQKVFG